jgi:parvulin-like peptidyl-prolyl isomerase
MKKLVVVLVLLLAVTVAVVTACGGSGIPRGAIAKVGSGIVTKADFDKIMAQAAAQAKASNSPFPKEGTPEYAGFKARVVDYLVSLELVRQKAAQLKITVTPKDVQDRINTIYQQYGGQKKVEALLAKQGMTLTDLQTQLNDSILQEKVQASIFKSVKVTDQQVQAYYKGHPQSFHQAVSRTTRHILLKTKAQAEKVRALLAANNTDANWAKVAKQYSQDPGTKNSGGDLGAVTQGQMVPPFDKATFALKVGEISQPVKSSYGWHVIEVTKINAAHTTTLAQAAARIRQTLLSQQQQVAWTAWTDQARKAAHIKYAAGYDPAKLNAEASASPTPAPASSPSPAPSASK